MTLSSLSATSRLSPVTATASAYHLQVPTTNCSTATLYATVVAEFTTNKTCSVAPPPGTIANNLSSSPYHHWLPSSSNAVPTRKRSENSHRVFGMGKDELCPYRRPDG